MSDQAALLISGSEDRFETSIVKMISLLLLLKIPYVWLRNPDNATTEKAFCDMRQIINEYGVLLVVIHAHGAVTGIESSSDAKILNYKKIIADLPPEPCRVQFVTATCYGHHLIKELIAANRSGLSTGVITTWEGFRTTYEDTVHDVAEAWSNSMRPEQRIGTQIFSTGKIYDSEFLGVQRWGAMHDKLFYPPK